MLRGCEERGTIWLRAVMSGLIMVMRFHLSLVTRCLRESLRRPGEAMASGTMGVECLGNVART